MSDIAFSAVISVTGTSNQIGSSGGLYPVISIASNPVLPGTGSVGLPEGNTAARAGSAGAIRFNTQLTQFEGTPDGASWYAFLTGTGTVNSVTGTTNQITASPTTGAVVVSLPSTVIAPGTLAAVTSVSAPEYLLTGSGSGTISILPQAAAGTYNFNLPTTAGTSGYLLTSAGGGASPMTWSNISSIAVSSITGTTNQITASASTGAVTLSIPSTFIAPGSITATTTCKAINFIPGTTSTVASGGTLALTNTSTLIQVFTGPTTLTVTLPDATTLSAGWTFAFNNNASGNVTINDNTGGLVKVMLPGSYLEVINFSTSFPAGQWDTHWLIPGNGVWSTSGMTVTGTIAATTSISAPTYLLTGSGSGTISILPQAAAGTYNLNLPTTAGTSGYLLTSAGGGSSPMTWTNLGSAAVTSISGTSNQITASASTGSVTLALASNAVLPGTAGVTLPQGNTAARGGGAGTIRLNTQAGVFESTVDGSTWATIETSAVGVISVSGTSNRITATPTTGLVVVDISASYVGQSSITTVGALSTGSLAAGFTPVTVPIGGTGLSSTTAYMPICGGTSTTSALQSVSISGASAGYVLTYVSSSALPTWQAVPGGSSGAWTKISTGTASSSASIAFTGLSNSYIAYMIEFDQIVPATNAVNFYCQFGTGGTPTYQTSAYYYGSYGYSTSSTTSDHGSNTAQILLHDSSYTLGTAAGSSLDGRFYLSNPSQSSVNQQCTWQIIYQSSGNVTNAMSGGAEWRSTTAVTAIKFYMSSGNISSGLFTLYGLTG